MNLPDRLVSWAQNEEMIDKYYTQHGKDCIEAAEKLEKLEAKNAKLWKCGEAADEMRFVPYGTFNKVINAYDAARAEVDK